ncbi:DUF1049 domain-containing protein [Merismopedia glauca]|uniref:DUF1049 domain-containing protein n=1 Tax=Merismopedia glauca CCAP 1448/3 TaxID=1296344 RepID=A0A2T1C404_9CYAN|nr:DUF1049 domain-containing protein [Merismopedia glauca]PSB02981.1 DUF1049 domain-containing protein [Merismopedia glauca CCAP 1448/3]
MRNISNLLTSAILAILVSAIAILSVQNATLVSLRLFGLRSINLPFGTILALSVSVGILVGAIAPIVWRLLSSSDSEFDDDDYFEEDF